MARWFVEECENDAEVARLAIEALQRELDAAGGPEDARAKAMLRYLLEIAAAPRIVGRVVGCYGGEEYMAIDVRFSGGECRLF